MRHSRPSSNPRSAGMTQPMPPAPPKPPGEPPTRRKAWITCGVLIAVTIAIYFYFKPRPPANPETAPAPPSPTEPAAPAVTAQTRAAEAQLMEPVQRVANTGLPPTPVAEPPKPLKEP